MQPQANVSQEYLPEYTARMRKFACPRPAGGVVAALFSLLLLLAGCAGAATDDPTEGLSAQEIYLEAKAELDNGQYETAAGLYSKLISRYPYGRYAQQALLEMAYAHYKDNELETAILTAERFIKLYPRHPSVAYAYYLRGLAAYPMEQNFLARWFNQDPAERDPRAIRRAMDFFTALLEKFPRSRYAADAGQRLVYLRNLLARHEVAVARFYLRREAFVAAANRARRVIEEFPRTPAVAEALEILAGAYEGLALPDLARDARRVLELNYPQRAAGPADRG